MTTPQQSKELSHQLLDMLRTVDANVSDVKDRVIRIEAQAFDEKITRLEQKVDEERKERISIQLQMEGIKTKIAPIVIFISMLASAGLTFGLNRIF